MTIIDRQTWAAELVADGTPLEVLPDSELTLDDEWAPYLQAKLTVVTPTDLGSIDPRTNPQVRLTAEQRYADIAFTYDLSALWGGQLTLALSALWGGQLTSDISAYVAASWWNPTYQASTALEATAWIRRRRVKTNGETVLELASAEALLQDLAWYGPDDKLFPDGASAPDATLRSVFASVVAVTAGQWDLAASLAFGTADTYIPLGQDTAHLTDRFALFTVGQSFWDYLQPFVQLGGLRLWGDLDGNLRLDYIDAAPPADVLTLDRLTAAEDDISRDSDEWGDGLIVKYLIDAGNGWSGTDIYLPLGGATKILVVEVNAISPISPSNPDPGIAAAMAARAAARGHRVPVEAVSNFAARPGWHATVDSSLGDPLVGYVQAITWNLGTAEMAVTPRDLEDA